jgi:hydrogenase maturation protein HypF
MAAADMVEPMADAHFKRVRIRCRGAVQGVGFRPAVHRLASELGLAGWVLNGPDGVTIEIEGRGASVESFTRRLPSSLPPLARLDAAEQQDVAVLGEAGFRVIASELGPRRRALVPPDAALCSDCREDMERPDDRRRHYAFTTCTNCGPRFSLVRSLPYDRERTAMACFPLCRECRSEYEDPSDRRFHAEPVCCPRCGPHLLLRNAEGEEIAEGPASVQCAREALAGGAILAVKGLGGFQLACRADSEDAVGRLRERKQRPTKPFAVMARDLATARRLVSLSSEDAALMVSPRSPVLLAPRRPEAPAASALAPGLLDLGVLLPTAPLHVELFRNSGYDSLVMTSGNLSEEPICRTNREAMERLKGVADFVLLHDRDVVRRVDDSVVRSGPFGPAVVRRARGYVPEPIALPAESPEPVLALGGHLQVTACLAVGSEAFLSQHVGDLDGEPARRFLEEVASGLEEFLEIRPLAVAVDQHPDYPSAWLGEKLAASRGGKLLRFQHHLAHAAAVLAERGAFPKAGESALGLSLDGTGYGPDGAAWGGEWLLVRGDCTWKRLGHIQPMPLVGGERAVLEPWRVAAAALGLAGEGELLPKLPISGLVTNEALDTVAGLASRQGWVLASGAGRLFEAAGALLGLCVRNGWEGEAAARLESLADSGPEAGPWPEAELEGNAGSPRVPSVHLLACAARRAAGGEDLQSVASGLHATFCTLAARMTSELAPEKGQVVALGGGCLVNRLLRRGLSVALEQEGFRPALPRAVPPGDGGLAYGQAVLAAAALAKNLQGWLLEGA